MSEGSAGASGHGRSRGGHGLFWNCSPALAVGVVTAVAVVAVLIFWLIRPGLEPEVEIYGLVSKPENDFWDSGLGAILALVGLLTSLGGFLGGPFVIARAMRRRHPILGPFLSYVAVVGVTSVFEYLGPAVHVTEDSDAPTIAWSLALWGMLNAVPLGIRWMGSLRLIWVAVTSVITAAVASVTTSTVEIPIAIGFIIIGFGLALTAGPRKPAHEAPIPTQATPTGGG